VLASTTKQADILEVISNLSSDEVFTPPKVTNALLDLLPEHVWSDPKLRWLDPGCKTGVFLREATKRLMNGLKEAIPDEQERLEHILRNMLFGVSITELTALMSRRTVYCSKNASGPHSTVHMPTTHGNIWSGRVEHAYVNGRCTECGASEATMERENRDNYAYAFIHEDGRAKLEGTFDMQFDVVVGNPPYQMEAEGSSRTMPLYQHFVDQAKALNPRYIVMIIPSRWMVSGLGLGEFRQNMLADRRIRHLVDYPNASEIFPGVELKGGVGYFLWDRENEGPCAMTLVSGDETHGPVERDLSEYDVLVRDSRALDILHKVQDQEEPSVMDILAVDKEFGMTSNFRGYSTERTPRSIRIYAVKNRKRVERWIDRKEIRKSRHLIDTWKVLIPQAYGAGETFPHQILGQPLVAPSPSCCTQTYLFLYLNDEAAAQSAITYVRTRFFRFLISLRKITQHATRSTYMWVPQQSWDRTWTDEELYAKYGITPEEQEYIVSIVREMPV
jgi:site-specific DNA-methyltransferase (adenine-specific)